MNQLRPPPSVAAGIDLWHPERASGRPPPAGFVLVANFHTHPVCAICLFASGQFNNTHWYLDG